MPLPYSSKHTSPIDIIDPLASSSSGTIQLPVQSRTIPLKQQPIILAPPAPDSGPLVAPLSGTTSVQPTHEQMHLGATNAVEGDTTNLQLTDEQIDFVTDLSSANVPSTDVVRVMERMRSRSRRATLGSQSVESGDQLNPGIAPPSYNEI